MYPYYLSKVLADQRVNDMLAASARRQRIPDRPTPLLTTISARVARAISLFRGGRSVGGRVVGARSSVTSVSTAGPMGCSA